MKALEKSKNQTKEKYREMIMERKNRILMELKKLSEGLESGGEMKPLLGSDLGDLSMLNLNSEINISLADRLAAALKEVDEALERVEDGSYGYCSECDEKIDERRLQIVPFALYCTPCQQKLEEENKKRAKAASQA